MSQLYYNDTPLSQMPASYPASRVTHESVSVTADGSKNYGALFNELFALMDTSKVTESSFVVEKSGNYYSRFFLGFHSASQFDYVGTLILSTTAIEYISMSIQVSSSWHKTARINAGGGTTITNDTTTVPSNGTVYTLYY